MEKESFVIQIPLCTKPGIPNINGFVYSKECLEKAIEEFKNRRSEGGYVFVTDIDYDNLHNNDFNFCDIPIANILGIVEDYNISNNTITCSASTNQYSFIKSYVENGGKALMRYTGRIDLNHGIQTVRDMRIVSFDLDEKTYNSVRDFYDKEDSTGGEKKPVIEEEPQNIPTDDGEVIKKEEIIEA